MERKWQNIEPNATTQSKEDKEVEVVEVKVEKEMLQLKLKHQIDKYWELKTQVDGNIATCCATLTKDNIKLDHTIVEQQ